MAVKLIKDKNFEFIYLLDVPVVYASVLEPKKKYAEPSPDAKNQSKREYAVTAFVTTEDREKLEDEFLLNKQFFEVGKDKTKTRKVKFPVKDADGNDTAYTPYKGLHGVQLTLNELTNSGKPANLAVVGKDGQPFEELVGNGSRANIKMFGYRNVDKLLNVSLNTFMVTEHVPYEGGSGGVVHDDVLGIDIDLNANKKPEPEHEEEDTPVAASDDFDDDVDF